MMVKLQILKLRKKFKELMSKNLVRKNLLIWIEVNKKKTNILRQRRKQEKLRKKSKFNEKII